MPQNITSKFFFAITAIAFGSGFQHGYHTSVLSLPAKMFQDWIKKTEGETSTTTWSAVVSIFPLGGMVGAPFIWYLSLRQGRKTCLIWNNVLVLLTVILFCSSKFGNSLALFICARFTAGVNAGFNSGMCQIFLTEVAPSEVRGAVGCLYQVMICFSVLLSQLFGLAFGNEETWIVLFVLPIIPAAFQVISLSYCPESPKYLLMSKDDEKKTINALIWLRGNSEDLSNLIEEDSLVKQLRMTSMKRVFVNQPLRRCLVKCILMNIGQQVCGINILICFSTYIAVNLEEDIAIVMILLSIIQIITTILAAFLVDVLGRRILLRSSFLAMGIATVIFANILIKNQDSSSYLKYLVVAASGFFFISHAIGAGPIPWFITAEYFNYSIREFTVAITVAFNWFFNLIISGAFLEVKDAIGNYVFLIFVILDLFFFCYTIKMSEVNQMSPVEIIEVLKI